MIAETVLREVRNDEIENGYPRDDNEYSLHSFIS